MERQQHTSNETSSREKFPKQRSLFMEDRSWMYRRHAPGIKGISIEYEEGVKGFMSFAISNAVSSLIRCPCAKCKNLRHHSAEQVEIHLYKLGFVSGYNRWTCHGEPFNPLQNMCSPSIRLNELYSSGSKKDEFVSQHSKKTTVTLPCLMSNKRLLK